MRAFTRWARTLGATGLVLVIAATSVIATEQAAEAAVVRPFALEYNADLYGDFILAGNGNSACPTPGSPVDPFGEPIATCATAQSGAYTAATGINDSYYMRWADVDASAATYNSSTASITIPDGATVEYARLSWGGDTGTIRLADNTVSALPGCNTRQFLAGAGTAVLPAGTPESTSPRFTVGAGTTAAVAPQVISRDALANVPASQPQFYAAYADVTSRFAGVATGGPVELTLGNVWTPQGFGCYSGWSITLVYAYDAPHANAPGKKHVLVYDGHVRQSSIDPATTVTATGFRASAAGARVGVVAFEGDSNISGDQFAVDGTVMAEPRTGSTANYFVSGADSASSPAVANNMSIDAKSVTAPIPAGATSTALTFSTSGDTFLAAGIALSVPVASLTISASTSPAGPYVSGAQVTRTITVESLGGPATGVVVDSTLAGCGHPLGSLAADTPVSYTCPLILGADATVIDTVTGLDGQGGPLTGSSETAFDVIRPEIDITATADQVSYALGDTITFSVRVENTGDTPLSAVQVTSPAAPACARSIGALGLAAESATSYTCTALAPIAGEEATLVATGAHLAGGTVTDSSTVSVATLGTVSGRVFADRDNNGAVGAGETGISGVTVTLSGTTDTGTTVSRSTTTDAGGAFSFAGVQGGTYTVAAAQPAAYDDGADTAGTNATLGLNDEATVVLAAGQSSTGTMFAERPTSSIAGAVYNDLDASGSREAGEPGIGGVTVTLSGQDGDGNTVSLSTTTDAADGAYSFTGLRPGSYQLAETQPSGYGAGTDAAGTAGGELSAANTISAIALPARTDAAGYLFGETSGVLAGAVFVDRDGDGIRTLGEPGLGGVIVTLSGTDANGPITARSAITGSDGNYAFGGLLAGTYTISESQPLAFGAGTGILGTAGGTVGTNVFSGVVLIGGAVGGGYLFGDTSASLSGAVFHDVDRSGTREATEPGLDGVVLTLTGTDVLGGDVDRASETAADGSFSFSGLLAGSYTITETQPSGYADGVAILGSAGGALAGSGSMTGVGLAGGENATGYLFAEQRGSLGGRVWLDADGDGIDGGGELGAAGVVVTLYEAAAPVGPALSRFAGVAINATALATAPAAITVIDTTTTDSDGRYSFDGLPAGSYLLGIDPGAGRWLTVPGRGSAASGSDFDWLTGFSGPFVVGMDGGATTIRATINAGLTDRADDLAVTLTGDRPTVSVGDTVRFTALVSNWGTVPAAGALVSISIPDGVRIEAGTGSGWNCTVSGQSVVCASSAAVLPGESFPPLTVTGLAHAVGFGSAVAAVALTDGIVDVDATNNEWAESLTIEAAILPPAILPPSPSATPSAPGAAAPAAQQGLAQTGGEFGLLATSAVLLLGVGGAVLVGRRRRGRSAAHRSA